MDISGTLNFFHYTSGLYSVYPLTRDEYKGKSILRRASYDYAQVMVEDTHEALKRILTEFRISPIQEVKSARANQARDHKIITNYIAGNYKELVRFRNNLAHENNKVNESLEMYDYLIKYIAFGEVMDELYWSYRSGLREGKLGKNFTGRHVVDKDRLLKEIEIRFKDNKKKRIKARYHLEHEEKVPNYIIDLDRIRSEISLEL